MNHLPQGTHTRINQNTKLMNKKENLKSLWIPRRATINKSRSVKLNNLKHLMESTSDTHIKTTKRVQFLISSQQYY